MTTRLPILSRRFPGLSGRLLGPRRTWLDNACLTPVPQEVAAAVATFYQLPPGCPLRNNSSASSQLELRIREGRDAVRAWLNARFSDEIVFTANTTAAINLLAGAFSRLPGAVLISDLEHNSNRLPWLEQELVELPWPPGAPFPMEAFRLLLRTHRLKLVSLAAVSNVTGQRLPIGEVAREAHEAGVPVHIDAAQAAIHQHVDITGDGADLLSFSLHKAYGPSGLGVLYARRGLHGVIRPLTAGGGSVDDHHDREVTPAAGAARFEFGLQNYAAQYAVPETIAFLREVDRESVSTHFQRLSNAARARLREVPGLRFIGGGDEDGNSIVNFYLEGLDSLRVAELLDLVGGIQVRAGRMCAHHYYHRYALPPSLRMSFGYHNTEEEVEYHVRTLRTLVQRYL